MKTGFIVLLLVALSCAEITTKDIISGSFDLEPYYTHGLGLDDNETGDFSLVFSSDIGNFDVGVFDEFNSILFKEGKTCTGYCVFDNVQYANEPSCKITTGVNWELLIRSQNHLQTQHITYKLEDNEIIIDTGDTGNTGSGIVLIPSLLSLVALMPFC